MDAKTIAKDSRAQAAAIALVVSVAGARVAAPTGVDPNASVEVPSARAATVPLAPSKNVSDARRLDVETDIDLAPGAAVTARGVVTPGAQLAAIDGCVGNYDEVTRICVLSPGPWELHSSCAGSSCEVTVRNTGHLPLKFSGYIVAGVPR